jgi:hypothetical protein
VLMVLGRRAWFAGDPDDSVALVMLSLWFRWQRSSESVASGKVHVYFKVVVFYQWVSATRLPAGKTLLGCGYGGIFPPTGDLVGDSFPR